MRGKAAKRITDKPACPICPSTRTGYLYQRNGYDIYRCSACSHVFVSPLPSPEDLHRFYDDNHQKKDKKSYDYTRHYGTEYSPAFLDAAAFAKKHLKKDVSILDVGCGNGMLMKLFIESGFEKVIGCEYSEEVLTQKALDDLDIRIGDLDDQGFYKGQFDFITAIYLLEHVLDPKQFLDTLARLLTPGGYIMLEVPSIQGLGAKLRGRNWSQMKPPEHLNYFTRKSIGKFMQESRAFEITHLSSPYPIPDHLILGGILGRLGLGGHLRIIARRKKRTDHDS